MIFQNLDEKKINPKTFPRTEAGGESLQRKYTGYMKDKFSLYPFAFE